MNKRVNYEVENQEFIIENYNKAKAFSSFFPAIAGLWGKPMWAFYVNRGQAIACMGTNDKDGAILEFKAANKAYRNTPLQSFRTFIKINGRDYYEPFQNNLYNKNDNIIQRMHITSYVLKLVDINKTKGIETTVEYFTIPNETIPAIARKLTIKNISKKTKSFECIDGLPLIIPYGTPEYMLKNISRLAEGWYNGVFYTKGKKVPVYKLPVKPVDKPEVNPVNEANFYLGFYYKAGKPVMPEYLIDSDITFGETRDFAYPSNFVDSKKFEINPNLTGKNKTPSGMGYFKANIGASKEFTYYSIVGTVNKVEDIDKYVDKAMKKDYLNKKEEENKTLINTIGNKVFTKSSKPQFDNYCSQNFLDNLLRGGYPVSLGEEKKNTYYAYSRIHGDMEREYNNFSILPEYFSQGNGNYRDVNQNRRSDVFINQDLKDEVLLSFMNLLQLDGFNPLKILGVKFKLKDKKTFLKCFNKLDATKVESYMQHVTTLGNFFNFLEKHNIKPLVKNEKLINKLMDSSTKLNYAGNAECYWSDHWHYNTDLIDNFLAIYPDKLNDLMFKNNNYTFYDNNHIVLPRDAKYVLFNKIKPRQLEAVCISSEKQKMFNKRKENQNVVRDKHGKGKIYKTNLFSKLLCLVVNKYASLDPEGVGLEMESDRPNWCDALNGLPGSFGSSTSESFELKRLLVLMIDTIEKLGLENKDIKFPIEFIHSLEKLNSATTKFFNDNHKFWDETHNIKEDYRVKTFFGILGKEKAIKGEKLKEVLALFLRKVHAGLKKAIDKKTGVVITNIEYEPIKYSIVKEKGKIKKNLDGLTCIKVLKFKRKNIPLFLEGPVHYLRVNKNDKIAKEFNAKVVNSKLYDKNLDMLKINAPLDGVSLDIGRIKIFTAGWLENESIWLHMEYKYLLELLRNNLSEEYYKMSDTMLVPFMDPAVYGRSIFENSSFIVSSAHPEKNIHGQGFVSRLSGSTAEFVSMWIAMTSGLNPFYLENNKLCLEFKPQLKGTLFTNKKEIVKFYHDNGKIENIIVDKNSFMFNFLGRIPVVYSNPSRKNTYGANGAKVSKIELFYTNGKKVNIKGSVIKAPYAIDVREKKVKRINVKFV